MSLFTDGRSLLDSVFALNAETITYTQGATSKTLYAKMGKTLFRTEDVASAVSVLVNARDFIVKWTDLDLTPAKGDTIAYGGHSYTVYAPSGEPCFCPHTTEAEEIRIHALLDEVEDA